MQGANPCRSFKEERNRCLLHGTVRIAKPVMARLAQSALEINRLSRMKSWKHIGKPSTRTRKAQESIFFDEIELNTELV